MLHRMQTGSCHQYWLAHSLLVLLLVTTSAKSFAADVWYPLRERALEVVEGSVLDFSNVLPNSPAGAQGWVQIDKAGHLKFSGSASTQRFQCASIVPSPPNGGFPDKQEADRWVTQMQRTGYNLVRLHYVDASLMTNRKGDFDFDPVALDRLHYLMAKLKAAGIYWVVDGLTSDNGAYGNVQPHRWKNLHDLKKRLFYDPAALAHWKRLVTALWGGVNPYTGLAPLNDPAMLGMVLVNEGGVAFVSTLDGRYAAGLGEPFGAWLATRYANDATLKKAWGSDATSRDHVGVSAEVPGEIRGTGKRSRDFAAFVADREATLYREMDAHVRSRGFKGLVTSYNNWDFNHENVVRNGLPWVDMHAYQSLPSNFASPGSRLAQTSLFDDAGRYGRVLSSARQWGKPFTVTEHGQPFWNQWRFESTAWLPALAAFQGWDAICQFAELPILLDYEDSTITRRQAIYPFGVGADPIARAGERLAALLFRRGDVEPSRTRLILEMDNPSLFASGNVWGQMPERLSRMALVAGTGLATQGQPAGKKTTRDMHLPLESGASGWLDKASNVALRRGYMIGGDPVAQLRKADLLPASNPTDFSDGVFESDTGQMRFDTPSKTISIATARTVALSVRSGSLGAGALGVARVSAPATVAVSAVDGLSIEQSKRLLVWVLTDAENTGMEFADSERTILKKLGRFPVRIRAVTGQIAIRHGSAAGLKVWAVDQAGRRVAEVPARAQNGFLRFALDNVIPEIGPVTYFEVAVR